MTLLEFPEMARSPRPPGKPPVPPVAEPEEDAASLVAGLRREADPDYLYFSAALRDQRIKVGLTQVQLSVKAGVALGTIHIIETARANPTLKTLITLAEAVGLKVGDLLPQKTSPNDQEQRDRLVALLERQLDAARKVLDLAREQTDQLEATLRQLRDGRPL